MKLWDKGFDTDKFIEEFTVGRDRELDIFLAPWDVLGSLAHIRMLESIDLLTKEEYEVLSAELRNIYAEIECGEFVIEDGVEDVHSQVELLLTRRLGDMGKKIHSGRSRNDQVLVDMKLLLRDRIRGLVEGVERLFDTLQRRSEECKDVLLPGYTHLQVAMPSSFGLWFGAYAESLADDLSMLYGAYCGVNRNPLGSAAGYGSSFPLDRTKTTKLLGFESMNYNVVSAQMSRGKAERNVAYAISAVAATVGRFAMDACLYNSQNFGFVRLPQECTTGSSIMPHKKNPDVFELIRGKCNMLQATSQQIGSVMTNLPSGYFRDMQLIKEIILPALDMMDDVLRMTEYIAARIEVNPEAAADAKYDAMFSVERVNQLVQQGVPFRDAYKQVGAEIADGNFVADRAVAHTHEGSIGNLCNKEIAELMKKRIKEFDFSTADKAIAKLLDR
ncbi:MAG: argininosuccinate lyase [Tidjanibacter sp.]|nr:argininosuccinate lyase [Tidjanibacter sp.]